MVYHLYVNGEHKSTHTSYKSAYDAHWNYVLDWCSEVHRNEQRGVLREVWRNSWDCGLLGDNEAVEILIRPVK